jgi:glycerate 2-kinase
MKVLIASDSFKDALSGTEVCAAISRGLKSSYAELEIEILPMADGGEGSLEAVGYNKRKIETLSQDALGREITSFYVVDQDTAYIELAKTAGLELLSHQERNPELTHTMGTGIQIKDALEKGFKKIVLFIGGSATNDAGMGLAVALGFEYLDKNNKPLKPLGMNMALVNSIVYSGDVDWSTIDFRIACDVQNPMYGPQGAAHIYAAQKGASAQQIERLDKGLQNLSACFTDFSGHDISSNPGAGAAGAVGAGMTALFGAKMLPGTEIIFKATDFENKLKSCDIVISGEGRIDHQSLNGKLIQRILETTKNQKVILLCGALEEVSFLSDYPQIIYVDSILNKPMNLKEALSQTAHLLEQKGFILGNLLKKVNFK